MLNDCELALSQFKAIFIKKFLNSLREKTAIITHILILVVLVVLGCLLLLSRNPQQDGPKLALQLSALKKKSKPLYGYHVDYRQNITQAERDIFVKVNTLNEIVFFCSYSKHLSENHFNSVSFFKMIATPSRQLYVQS